MGNPAIAETAQTDTSDEYQYDLFAELFGALNEAPDADHAKILKSFLGNGIDTLREHSVFQLDLLEKLASIALNNVQDVRLYSLEARVREIEQGKPITFGDILGEVFFAIAVEAVILTSVTYAAPVLASLGALILTNIKTSARSPMMTRRVQAVMKKLDAIDYRRSELVNQDMRLLSRLHSRTPKGRAGKKRKSWYRNRKVSQEELTSTRVELDYLNRNRQFYAQKLEDVTKSSLVTTEEFAPRYQNIAEIKLSKNLDTLKKNYDHHIDSGKTVFRAFSAVAAEKFPDIFSPTDQQGGEEDGTKVELYESFTTSHSVMQMISQCESLKLDVILHYSQMRAIMDAVDEKSVFDAIETVFVLEEIENNLFDVIDISETMLANLEDFVVPMELAIWLIYLETNNVLQRDKNSSNKSVSIGGYSSEDTRFIGDNFVVQIIESTPSIRDSPRTTFESRYYPGLQALDEHQAYYLYHKFAKKSFALYADQVPVSKSKDLADFIHKDVANDAFSDVLAMQKVFFWTGENEERSNLIKEMGVVVIEYFNYLRDHIAAKKTYGFSDTIAEGTAIATLLSNIDKPILAETDPVPPRPSETADDWLAQQEAAHEAEWEERTLTTLDTLNYEYQRALVNYEHYDTNVREKYGDMPVDQLNDFFLVPSLNQISSVRTAIEGYIGSLQNDEQERMTDAIAERIDQLEQLLQDSPAEKEMFSTFPR